MTEEEAVAELNSAARGVLNAQADVVQNAKHKRELIDILHDDFGWSYQDIAAELGVHPSAITHQRNRS